MIYSLISLEIASTLKGSRNDINNISTNLAHSLIKQQGQCDYDSSHYRLVKR